MPDTVKITTHKQRFSHVNATNLNSYLNIICFCISYASEKNRKKKQNSDFLSFLVFLKPKNRFFKAHFDSPP